MENVRQISSFILGDMKLNYTVDDAGIASMELLPNDGTLTIKPKKTYQENLLQVKITGDIYNEAYAMGVTLRNSETTRRLKFDRQESVTEDGCLTIITHLKDDRGYVARHILSWEEGATYVETQVRFTNNSQSPINLELLESFSLSGLTPYVEGDASEAIDLYRIRGVWSGEGKVQRTTLEDLALEKSWAEHAVRCERYGQAGSMPTNHFFPFGVIYDKKNHVFWGAQIAHNAAWQMEVYRKDEGVSFSGGLADREFGHWVKELKPSESFTTPKALISTAHIEPVTTTTNNTDNTTTPEDAAFDLFTQRLTSQGVRNVLTGPESEHTLPVIFNEYCTTWGNPSDANIRQIVDCIRDLDISYFVIDCGWFKQEGIPWDRGMGDYEVSTALFPEGLDKTVNYIKNAGMVPGIWFEIENVAEKSRAYQDTEHLLKRDGKPLTTYFRRFRDMNDPWVREELKKKVIGTLKEYGFGYMKIDYNETFGIGCDGAESLGEGLRRNMAASEGFIRLVKQEVPGIILENCASGGHRLEPLMMSICSMASFSDAHECIEIPVIAANLHRTIHPAQSQIWAVIRQTDELKRITYSLAATFLGRMCISGDVTNLSEAQRDKIKQGIDFYKKAAPIILLGQSIITGTVQKSMRHPKGYQAVIRACESGTLVVVHSFEGAPKSITIDLSQHPTVAAQRASQAAALTLTDTYQSGGRQITYENGIITIENVEDFDAVALILK